jgi:rod shape-determining protein MreC
MAVSASFTWCSDIWRVYFATVSAREENGDLKRQLAHAMASQNQCMEIELENSRLRRFIDFSNGSENALIAAKVIGKDPSPWFQTLMINKGFRDGILKGLPVLVSEGVVGQIVYVSEKVSRVLLITDRNSSVDALVQSSRARGIVQGNNTDRGLFKYSLRKDEIALGDIIISSGLDQVFPKGLRIGEVLEIKKENSDLFQMIFIKTFVDFHKLEEVLVSRTYDALLESSAPSSTEVHEDSGHDQPENTSNHETGEINEVLKPTSVSKPVGKTEIIDVQEEHISFKPAKKSAKNASFGQKNIQVKKDASIKPSKKEEQ